MALQASTILKLITMDVTIKEGWHDLTLGEYQKIFILLNKLSQDIEGETKELAITDFYSAAISLFSGKSIEEVEDMPLGQYGTLCNKLQYLIKEPKINDVKKDYIIGGKKYSIVGLYDNISSIPISKFRSVQYINLLKMIDKRHEDIDKGDVNIDNMHIELAICLKPANITYGDDDYNISEHANNIKDNMLASDALGLNAFFLLAYQSLMIATHKSSLNKSIKMMKKEVRNMTDKEKKQKLKEAISQTKNLKSLLRTQRLMDGMSI